MATTKRKRGAVSYKEPSSDEDISENSGQEERVQRSRAAPSRRSTRRRQPSSEQPSSARSNRTTQSRTATQSRTSRASREIRQRERPQVSYKDVSTDDEDPDGDFEVDDDDPPPRTKIPKMIQLPQRPKSRKEQEKPRRRLGAPLKPNEAVPVATPALAIPTDGHKPAWASLPYHVLLQVFVYASHPLRDVDLKPMPSISWLVQVATMCSAFRKPALTALYRNPPIFAMKHKRRDLVLHLVSPPIETRDDHRVMVKRLELDATQMTALTDHANSTADLAAMVRSLKTLREIDVFDPKDRPPFRKRMRHVRRWVYPAALFDALRQSDLRLRSWRWNSTFCDQGPLWIKSLHGESFFQSLREVTLTKFHPIEMREDRDERVDVPGQPTTEELIASAIATLPNLKTLSFETCGIVSGRLLPLLPTNLVSLNITNCGELLSEALQAFLATHGSQLEDLVLNNNQALDLSFLVDLKRSCPRLEVLRMDLTYYSSLSMSSDNDPLYEELLGEDEIPTWPSTLRVIEMEYLRKWNASQAANFFSSLTRSANELPLLQEIVIVAMVDTDWRQRAGFRMKWTEEFTTVFARKWEAPNPHLASLKAYREWKAHGDKVDAESEKNDSLIEGVSDAMEHDAKVEEGDSDSDVPLVVSRKQKQNEQWGSKRLRSRSKANTSYDEASVNESGSEDEEVVATDDPLFVQGRCHTVIFRIDNSRPREELYAEADFLDAEPSGDEEWNENNENDEEGEGSYAW